MSDALIKVKNLTIKFPVKNSTSYTTVVDDVSFKINAGECVGIVGESGSGKTLTALSLLQLLPLSAVIGDNSSVIFNGNDLLSLTQKEVMKLRGSDIAVVFQDAITALNPVKTIGWQIAEVLRVHQIVKNKDIKSSVYKLLQDVGICDVSRCYLSYPHELSGGMRQRAMIAMALACKPKLLILDEPTTSLDVTVQAKIIDLLKDLQQQGMAMLFISHDLSVVSKLADYIVVMKDSTVVEQNKASDFFINPTSSYSKMLLSSLPNLKVQQKIPVKKENIVLVDGLKVHFPIKKGLLQRTSGYVAAVNNVSFTVNKGETLAIVGESGSGKTTVAKSLVRLLNATSGSISLNGIKLSSWINSKNGPWHRNIQMVYQDPYTALNPRMRVFDSIVEGMLAQIKSISRNDLIAKVDMLLEQVGLSLEYKWRFPHEFSGGERQRICIARALALNPGCLILDEPTSALDVSTQNKLLDLLLGIQEQLGISYILITHNIAVVAMMAHKVVVMHNGNTIEHGSSYDVLQNPTEEYTKTLLGSVPTINSLKEV